jgi:hypothetical protein
MRVIDEQAASAVAKHTFSRDRQGDIKKQPAPQYYEID